MSGYAQEPRHGYASPGDAKSHRPTTPPGLYDSWRPTDQRREHRDGYHSYHDHDSRRHGSSFQPKPSRGNFDFRVEKPAGVGSVNLPAGSGRDHRGPPRHGGRPLWRPPRLSERALVSGDYFRVPVKRVGESEAGVKFRNVDELSDDEEVGMDISGSESEGPARKRVRTQTEPASALAAAKWSNPDPYTALPCSDETTRKKRDMVQLIRRARLGTPSNPTAPPATLEFIGISSDEEDDDPSAANPVSADFQYTGAATDRSGPLGSRKRTLDDEIKPPNYVQFKRTAMTPARGNVLEVWRAKRGQDACPWARMRLFADDNMPVRLHKEIIDFYEFVKPKDFEHCIRLGLIAKLEKALKRQGRHFATAHVKPFGSFVSGLYLPTADMDIVICSASFMCGGTPAYRTKSCLFKFQRLLMDQAVAEAKSIEVIAYARIPLVKYVDKATGIKVDVSFENLGGVQAVETFLRWRQEYPVMPILVTIIKHFLLMRGLNEPVNGGIGGFSVICLVVSMLQLMPQVQSRDLVGQHHLGELLLDFFELYGRQLKYDRVAISLTHPVGYVRKSEVSSFAYKKTNRLSIIDPNNSSNDISGGSSNTREILYRFHDAFLDLRDRMDEIARHPDRGGILDVLFRGDYSSFQMQRSFLGHLYEATTASRTD